MKTHILSIGDELILGRTVDTNAAWLAGRLCQLGLEAGEHLTVADRKEDITAAIDRAARAADVVLITGGLGPTEDDVTRFAIADVMGVELALDETMSDQIEAFFRHRKRKMRETNRVQAMFPVGATPIPNTCGTAPGIHARVHDADLIAMPGVPREMRVMYDQWVAPRLAQTEGPGRRVLRYASVGCFGAGESDIGATIADLMRRGRNPSVGTSAHDGLIIIRIYSWGQTPAEAEDLMRDTEAEVCRRLGDLVAWRGEQTLESAVGAALIERKQTVCTAESCTGGLVAKLLTDVPGSSDYFVEGFVTYSNPSKARQLGVPMGVIEQHGAVSPQVADAMATGARATAGTDYALALTGIAGPTGGTAEKPVGLVYIALAGAGSCDVHEHHFGASYDRQVIRDRACKTALNYLRLRLK